jgi:hypothetical protein
LQHAFCAADLDWISVFQAQNFDACSLDLAEIGRGSGIPERELKDAAVRKVKDESLSFTLEHLAQVMHADEEADIAGNRAVDALDDAVMQQIPEPRPP